MVKEALNKKKYDRDAHNNQNRWATLFKSNRKLLKILETNLHCVSSIHLPFQTTKEVIISYDGYIYHF